MGGQPPRALTLDSGALIAVEQGQRRVEVAIRNALQKGAAVLVPAAALAQVWRGSARQARLSRMLAARSVEVVPLDGLQARLVGVVCGRQERYDIVDGSVAVVARRFKSLVLTSDPDHIRKLDPALPIVRI